MWQTYNPNPDGAKVGDCVIRALSKAFSKSWEDTYLELCMCGLRLADMPSANNVWGAYLKEHGYTRHILPNNYPDCYTVKDFCAENPNGMYILSLNGHVVCVKDGDYYDSWDSGDEAPIYYWKKGE